MTKRAILVLEQLQTLSSYGSTDFVKQVTTDLPYQTTVKRSQLEAGISNHCS